MQSPKLIFLAGLASATLLTTACGGGANGSSRSSNPTPTPTANPTPTPTAAPTPTPEPSPTPEPTPTEAPAPTKVSGPLDPVQEEVVDEVVVNQVGSQLPAPFNTVTECVATSLNHLIDVPDAVLAGAEGLAEGADPFDAFNSSAAEAQGAIERFAASLQNSFQSMVDRGECDPNSDPAAASGNPFVGTPLEPVGAALEDLIASFPAEGEDPNLSSVTGTVAPLLAALGDAFDTLPAELTAAPVLGAAINTMDQAIDDVAAMMTPFGQYDADGTTAAIQTVIGNLMTGVLVNTLPLDEIDPAIAPEVQAGIDTLTATLGDGLGEVITPLFNEGLNGAASPILDPVEGVLATIIAEGNPLDGVLADLSGDLAGTPADAVLGMIISAFNGTPLENLLVAAGASPTSATPLALLTELQAQLGALDTILGTVATQNENPSASLSTILVTLLGSSADGSILDGLL